MGRSGGAGRGDGLSERGTECHVQGARPVEDTAQETGRERMAQCVRAGQTERKVCRGRGGFGGVLEFPVSGTATAIHTCRRHRVVLGLFRNAAYPDLGVREKGIRHCRGRRHPGVAAARDIPSVACGLLLAEARGGGILVCGQSQGEDREEVPGTAVRIRAGGCGTVPADTRGGHVARQDYRAVDGILSG